MKKAFWFGLPIISLLFLWEIISHSGIVNISLFPSPSIVAKALWGFIVTGILFTDVYVSIGRLAIGLFSGTIVGILIGLLTGRIKQIALLITPIIQIFRPIPPVAIIPLVIVWFGIGNDAKIIAIAFAVFFPVWINTHIGAKQISQKFLWGAKLLTKYYFRIFSKVIFPACLPFIIAGVRIGISIAFIMIFVSELAGASKGIGYRISISHLAYRIDEMMAALIVLGILGAVTDQLFVYFINKIFPWLKFISK